MTARVTTRAVKMHAIDAAQRLMERVGCQVTRTGTGPELHFAVTIPADSADPHGDRLTLASST